VMVLKPEEPAPNQGVVPDPLPSGSQPSR
jgi:hypothetical protein